MIPYLICLGDSFTCFEFRIKGAEPAILQGTEETQSVQMGHELAWFEQALNLTGQLATTGYMSVMPCYTFGYKAYSIMSANFIGYTGVGDFFASALFNLMGNVIQLKNAVNAIDEGFEQ